MKTRPGAAPQLISNVNDSLNFVHSWKYFIFSHIQPAKA